MAEKTRVQTERFAFHGSLADTLRKIPPGGQVLMTDWPMSPGKRIAAVLKRVEIYSPEAKIYRVDKKGLVELPRSRWMFFQGRGQEDSGERFSLSLDPDSGKMESFQVSTRGTFHIRQDDVPGAGRYRLMEDGWAYNELGEAVSRLNWSCGADDLPVTENPPRPIHLRSANQQQPSITSLHGMILGVDTDNEFMSLKFSDNTTNATNYVAALISGISVVYERDLLVRLLQGTTYLRVSSSPDPYTQTSAGGATVAQLQEFGNYWSANMGAASRGLATMLSGKQTSNYSSSGIAWVGDTGQCLCSTTYGYSFFQVFKYPGSTAASDVSVAAHEIGHNFGSPHTHCYSPPIDLCYNQTGCYAGATSCPAATTINGVANVRGTLMSYCHMLGGCSSTPVFHPTCVAKIAPLINLKVGTCITPISNPVPTLSSMSPTSATAGSTAFNITVNGTNYVSDSVVKWNGSSRNTTFVSAGQLTAAITAADIAAAGSASVTVHNTTPGGGTSSALTFTILSPSNPVPMLSSLSPSSVTAGSSAFTMTLNGGNFLAGSVVQWNGGNRTTTYVSSTQLTVSVSASDVATAGSATVSVFNPSPGGGTSNTLTFTIQSISNPVPIASSLSPSSVSAGSSDFTLTLNGGNFLSGSVVRWNGGNRTTTFVNSTQLNASISASDVATAGTANVAVFNPSPGGGTSNTLTFTIQSVSNPVPALSSLTPSGSIAGSSAFTLAVNGTNFINGSTVRWNDSSRTTSYISANQLSAYIPATDIVTAGTARVTVFNGSPGGGTSNMLPFNIVAAATLNRKGYLPVILKDVVALACGFDSPFNGDMSGWQVHSGSWTAGSQYMTGTGLTGVRSSVSRATAYSNLVYEAKLMRYGTDTDANTLYIRGTVSPLDSSNQWYSGYGFQFTRDGSYFVFKRVAGVTTTLQSWTDSAALYQGSAWNTLRVVASGTSLSFYANGALLWSGSDASLSSGSVGIGMYCSYTDTLLVDWATLSCSP